jgi:hypothetical protein
MAARKFNYERQARTTQACENIKHAHINGKGSKPMLKIGKSIGLKDMHPMQVKALLNLIGVTLNLAAKTEDMKRLADVEADCDELVRMFGGNGVSVKVEVE